MKKAILTLFMFINSLFFFGQQQLQNEFGGVYYDANLYKTKCQTTTGSPYLSEDFIPAKINDITKTKLVRFDAVSGNLEVLLSEGKVVALDNNTPYRISLLDGSNRLYKTLKFMDAKNQIKASFFEVLDSTKHFQLYLKENKKFFKKVKAQGYADEKPAQFKKTRNGYYVTDFVNQSGKLLLIPQKMKTFPAFFGKVEKSIKKFIKDNKLKIDNQKDLSRIFQFYFQNRTN